MYEMERIKNGRIVRCTRIQECNLHCSDCNLTDICDDPLKEVDPDWTNPYKIGTQEHDAWDESERVGKVSPPEPVKSDEGLLEQLTEWVTDYKDVASRNALAETPKESADYLLSLIRAELETARLTEEQLKNLITGWEAVDHSPGGQSLLRYLLNAQLEAVKKILGKV